MNKQKHGRIALLLRWAGRDKYYIYAAVLLALISGLAVAVLYYAVYSVIGAVYASGFSPERFPGGILPRYGVIIFISILVRFLPYWGSIIASHKGAYNALYKVRCMVINHMGKVPLGSLESRRTGELKSVLTDQVEKLELYLAHHLTEFVYYISGPAAVFIYLCTVNVKLALVSLIPLVLALAVMAAMFAGQTKEMGPIFTAMANLNSGIIEYINGMKLIKAYDLGARSFKTYSGAVDEHRALWNRVSRKMGPPYAAYVVIVECGMALMLPLGGFMLLAGSILPGVFLLFAFAGSLYLTELRPLQELGSNFANVLGAVDKVQELLNIPAFTGDKPFPSKHTICFEDVSFTYDGHNPVLRHVNMNIAEGEKIALVGASGAGKTTLVELAARSYEATQGHISIGGVDIQDIRYEEILKNTAIVFQKSFLSKESIVENIRMGTSAALEQVRAAAKQAQIDDFIMSLPGQYDTRAGEYGSRLSGGEKQRIAIARAILKNAPVLILDEAASAADPENQVEIDRAIQSLCRGKTVMIVAHRLDVVFRCDKVAVVERGEVTAFGAHDEVIRQNEYYRKAWDAYNRAREIRYSAQGGDA
ncbi:MAG: ABC transporter ATP-binding protein/permease [Treponema sp.]|jgi:ATP-binding cassette subfamily B protein|nr:ABC transporter ATP-binding protein/permease [Treponema sp.]